MTKPFDSLSPRAATRVVVIDDDDFEREFLTHILVKAGFDATGLPSVIGVTNQIVRDKVQVVVIDVMMPTIRGDKLATLLRKNSALANIGVVMVSSLSESEFAAITEKLHVDAFVSKANVRTELAPAVLRAASRRRMTSGGI
jgi:PleD family two-component response regulator